MDSPVIDRIGVRRGPSARVTKLCTRRLRTLVSRFLLEQQPRQSILVDNPRTGLPLQTPHSGRETFIRYNLKKVYNKSQIKGLYYHDEQAPTEVLRNQIIFLMNDKRRVVNLHSKWMDIDINDLFVFLSEQYKDIIAQNGGEVKRVTMPN
jgi:hypothetical protein